MARNSTFHTVAYDPKEFNFFLTWITLFAIFIDNLSLVRSPILLWRRVDAREKQDVGEDAWRPEVPRDEADDANEHSEPYGASLVAWIPENLAHCLRSGQCCRVPS